jgi:sugar lactone lactonase YvrE
VDARVANANEIRENPAAANLGSSVMKFSPNGELLMTIGTPGAVGDPPTHLTDPNDVLIAPNGTIYIGETHSAQFQDEAGPDSKSRISMYRPDGTFIKSFGEFGYEDGQLRSPHSLAMDSQGRLFVADRGNVRIQIFDQDGNYLRELNYAGLPCSIDFAGDYIWMVNGFTGQLLQLDKSGNVLAGMGSPGDQPDQFGEAHYVAASPTGEIYVADVTRGVHKFVPR